MKYYLSICSFVFLLQGVVQAQSVKKALFFGNSYTFQFDLPQAVSKLAASKGDSLYVEASTGGGLRLKVHSADPQSYTLMNKLDWDFVVLQEQSQLPSFPPSQVQSEVFPYAKKMCDSINALPFCTRPLFFMTWGRKNGDQQNCQFYPPLCTYEGMQLELRKNYLKMAQDNGAWASPVGMVWRELRKTNPNINLYDTDESHPSREGSYAAACTFYAVMFHKTPIGASYLGGVSQSHADSIQAAAHRIVFDSLKTWNILPDSVDVKFTPHISNDTVTFQNLASITYDSLIWDFGDGNFSYQMNPTHIYGASGRFKVTLKAFYQCKKDTLSKEITVSKSSPSVTPNFSFSGAYDTIQFNYTGSLADSVFWDFGNSKTSTQQMPTHIYGVADTFSVKLIAWYSSAKDSVSKTVITRVNTNTGILRPLNPSSSKIVFYPNPVNNFVQLESTSEITEVELLDINGKSVLIKEFENVKYAKINLEFLEKGIYVLVVKSHTGQMYKTLNVR